MSDQAAEMNTRDVRAKLADVVHDAAVRGKTTYITHRGRRVAAVVPVAVAEAAERPESPQAGSGVTRTTPEA